MSHSLQRSHVPLAKAGDSPIKNPHGSRLTFIVLILDRRIFFGSLSVGRYDVSKRYLDCAKKLGNWPILGKHHRWTGLGGLRFRALVEAFQRDEQAWGVCVCVCVSTPVPKGPVLLFLIPLQGASA